MQRIEALLRYCGWANHAQASRRDGTNNVSASDDVQNPNEIGTREVDFRRHKQGECIASQEPRKIRLESCKSTVNSTVDVRLNVSDRAR